MHMCIHLGVFQLSCLADMYIYKYMYVYILLYVYRNFSAELSR